MNRSEFFLYACVLAREYVLYFRKKSRRNVTYLSKNELSTFTSHRVIWDKHQIPKPAKVHQYTTLEWIRQDTFRTLADTADFSKCIKSNFRLGNSDISVELEDPNLTKVSQTPSM